MTTLIAFASDWHANTRGAGLCPPVVHLEQSDVIPNEAQQAVWKAHVGAWQLLAGKAIEHRAQFIAMLVGDLVDTNGRPGKHLITTNDDEILDIAAQCIKPVTQVVDRHYIVRGTEYHAGPQCWIEERMAKGDKTTPAATPDTEAGTASWWWLPLEVEGVRFDIAHHPRTSGSRPWTAQSAAARESAIIAAGYARRGERLPDVAVRAHVHYAADSGMMCRPRVVFCPPWQLTTSYGFRLGVGGDIEPVGVWWFLVDDGRILQMDIEIYEPRRHEWASTS